MSLDSRLLPAHAYIITAVCAYLLGSVPTGFLVARARGVDIRSVGSGNIGATNAFRVLGRRVGILVLLADFAKGLMACLLVPTLVMAGLGGTASESVVSLRVVAAIGAVLGHNYPCWLGFKGGKGVATSAGALAALVPGAFLIGFGVWVVFFGLTRYVSLASIAAAIAVPVATWFTSRSTLLTAVTSALGLVVILKHRTNVRRLIAGTENRITFGSGHGGQGS